MSHYRTTDSVEGFLTLGEIAEALHIPQYRIERSARAGAFRIYYVGDRRKRARLNEVIAWIEASAEGGH